ncbi:MAG: hypothetical protein JO129_03845 [Candidatus Dependentiae bacterium]|nr:hypothetical protein [Candidatus Dependentiae bacterium]
MNCFSKLFFLIVIVYPYLLFGSESNSLLSASKNKITYKCYSFVPSPDYGSFERPSLKDNPNNIEGSLLHRASDNVSPISIESIPFSPQTIQPDLPSASVVSTRISLGFPVVQVVGVVSVDRRAPERFAPICYTCALMSCFTKIRHCEHMDDNDDEL